MASDRAKVRDWPPPSTCDTGASDTLGVYNEGSERVEHQFILFSSVIWILLNLSRSSTFRHLKLSLFLFHSIVTFSDFTIFSELKYAYSFWDVPHPAPPRSLRRCCFFIRRSRAHEKDQEAVLRMLRTGLILLFLFAIRTALALNYPLEQRFCAQIETHLNTFERSSFLNLQTLDETQLYSHFLFLFRRSPGLTGPQIAWMNMEVSFQSNCGCAFSKYISFSPFALWMKREAWETIPFQSNCGCSSSNNCQSSCMQACPPICRANVQCNQQCGNSCRQMCPVNITNNDEKQNNIGFVSQIILRLAGHIFANGDELPNSVHKNQYFRSLVILIASLSNPCSSPFPCILKYVQCNYWNVHFGISGICFNAATWAHIKNHFDMASERKKIW